METINDRMEMLINERFGGNKAAMAKDLGIDRATLSNYIGNKRRSKPSVDMVTKIVRNLHVDAYWLLTGDGEPCPAQTSVSGHNNQINGDGASGNINGSPCADVAVLEERVKAMQQLLDEKERTIKILMDNIERNK